MTAVPPGLQVSSWIATMWGRSIGFPASLAMGFTIGFTLTYVRLFWAQHAHKQETFCEMLLTIAQAGAGISPSPPCPDLSPGALRFSTGIHAFGEEPIKYLLRVLVLLLKQLQTAWHLMCMVLAQLHDKGPGPCLACWGWRQQASCRCWPEKDCCICL